MMHSRIKLVSVFCALIMMSACVVGSSGPTCTHVLPDHLNNANDRVILSSNVTPEQMFKFNRCRAGSEDEEAQYRLGLNYEEGVGVTQNYDAAARWYKAAADEKSGLKWRYNSEIATNVGPETLGHPIAQYRLGLMYLDGRGLKQSDVMAKLWIGVSAEQGYELAVIKELEYTKEYNK